MDHLVLKDGEKHVTDPYGLTWVVCAHCGVYKRNASGSTAYEHSPTCPVTLDFQRRHPEAATEEPK